MFTRQLNRMDINHERVFEQGLLTVDAETNLKDPEKQFSFVILTS